MPRGALLLIALLFASRASAEQDDKQRCVDAFTAAQADKLEHHLLAAKAKALICAAPACPSLVQKECSALLAELDAAIPTVIPRARDEEGQDVLDVHVSIDGVAVTVDGKAIALDPGKHLVRFEAKGRAPVEQSVMLAEGERLRSVAVVLPRQGDKPPPPVVAPAPKPVIHDEPGRGPLPWITASVAVVGFVGFGAFGLLGRSEILDLRDRCPRCTQGEIDAANRKLLVADVSLGVALVGTGLSVWLFTRTPSPSVAWDPNTGTAMATLFGRF